MNSADFQEFAESLDTRAARAVPERAQPPSRVTVLGGGDDALVVAALALAADAQVTLFSAYGRELEGLRKAGGVTLRGDGPVGTFAVDRSDAPAIRTTAELDGAVAGAEAIVLTGPVHKQRTYAMVLADHLSDGQVLVLPNARSLGAVETAWLLKVGGCDADIAIAEFAGAPFWPRREGAALVLSACPAVAAAVLPQARSTVLEVLGGIFPNLQPAASSIHLGFADAAAAVELPALVLGGPGAPDGGPVVPEGGKPLPENRTFRHLIGPAHAAMTARLWDERRAVAAAFGVRDLPDPEAVIAAVAGVPAGAGARPVPDAAETEEILRAGVVASLVPLVSAAAMAGVPVPASEALITLVSTVLGRDLAGAGRRLETIGIGARDVSAARRSFDALLKGGARG